MADIEADGFLGIVFGLGLHLRYRLLLLGTGQRSGDIVGWESCSRLKARMFLCLQFLVSAFLGLALFDERFGSQRALFQFRHSTATKEKRLNNQ